MDLHQMRYFYRSTFVQRMGRAAAVLGIVAVACGGSSGPATSAQPLEPIDTPTATSTAPAGDPAPTREFQTFEGETVSLADFTGKPVVLNFWASWCPSCVAEMANAFRPVQQDLGDEITFIGMNIQDDRALANQLLDETGVVWVAAEDADGELYLDLGGIAMPFTVYIATDGSIVEKHNGPLTESQLRDQIEEAF